MASYDFIENSASAYRYVWEKRIGIVRLAAFPVLIKFICTMAVFALGMEEHYLRQGLVLIPSYFVEGIFLVKILQMAVLTDQQASGFDRRAVQAAIVLYVLIKVVAAFLGGLGVGLIEMDEQQVGEPSAFLLVGLIAFLVFLVWGFRLLWLYIPLALGYPMLGFLKKIKGMASSFVMMGSWLISVMPLALVLVLVIGVLGDVFGHSEENPSQIYRFILIVIQSVVDLLASLLVTLAIGFGVREVMEGKAPKNKDFL